MGTIVHAERPEQIHSRRWIGRGLRVAAAVIGLFLLAGLVAPLVDGSRWSGPIGRQLEAMLGRRVAFEQVHFTLLSGPGFSLENVTIGDDARYGAEPFAFVPTLEVRLRPDKLLLGRVQVSTLRLMEPSLNFVKIAGGTWNVVELIRRLGAPRRAPFDLFPVLAVEGARIDFKFGQRKTTLYVTDSDWTVYPERSGKVFVQVSGSPARTDRASGGFGHLRGRVNWFPQRAAREEQLQADLTLDPSNLSEMATLLQGHDAGVHGTVSTRLQASGPLERLAVHGSVQLGDLHRWDLLPHGTSYFSNDDWTLRFQGTADLLRQDLDLRTGEAGLFALTVRIRQFLTQPDWLLTAGWQTLPAAELVPVMQKMGIGVPDKLTLAGLSEGSVSLESGRGLSGQATVKKLAASVAEAPPVTAEQVTVQLEQDHLHLAPTEFMTGAGRLQAGGDFYWLQPRFDVTVGTAAYPIAALRAGWRQWWGDDKPLAAFEGGTVAGQVSWARTGGDDPVWNGRLQFSGAAVAIPGLAEPLRQAEGRLAFHWYGPEDATLEVTRFSGMAGTLPVRGSYGWHPGQAHTEHLRAELGQADVHDIEGLLRPTLEGQGWLGRWHVGRRTVPRWLAERDLEGDLAVQQLAAGGSKLGRLDTHFTLRGTALQVSRASLRLGEGDVQGRGMIRLDLPLPHYEFAARVRRYRWRGGVVEASGELTTAGLGMDVVRNLQAAGTFAGTDVSVTPEAYFAALSGDFHLAAHNGWPDLQLASVRATEARAGAGEEVWAGQGAAQSDGRLVLDLQQCLDAPCEVRGGQPRHIAATLSGAIERPVAADPVEQ